MSPCFPLPLMYSDRRRGSVSIARARPACDVPLRSDGWWWATSQRMRSRISGSRCACRACRSTRARSTPATTSSCDDCDGGAACTGGGGDGCSVGDSGGMAAACGDGGAACSGVGGD
eukprot:402766-Prymnesium_polylepis.1